MNCHGTEGGPSELRRTESLSGIRCLELYDWSGVSFRWRYLCLRDKQ
jgi:hypothetical protein